jgi:hypothetical protein
MPVNVNNGGYHNTNNNNNGEGVLISADAEEETEEVIEADKQLSKHMSGPPRHRTAIPPRPNCTLNLWSFVRDCIGKELTKVCFFL